MQSYKGFEAISVFDQEKGLYVGRVVNCEDAIVFVGNSPDQLGKSFQYCVDTYLAICKEKGYRPTLALRRTYQQMINEDTTIYQQLSKRKLKMQ